ncbi:NAD(P)-binding Rossmann-fold superfamily protein [Rhynchospora pubera]|uniref:NAD(P)-binding Rossmann-fold superfamily protein n=1 Tax=Rhynchospora pubera TaxID=906938 RepID=A0AAV8C3B5_9POAL|nr:NAD(P)-binding Rossmann-fold superfamily protein [Rhynchospora pubera]
MGLLVEIRAASSLPIKALLTYPNPNSNSNSNSVRFSSFATTRATSPSLCRFSFSMASSSSPFSPTSPIETSSDSGLNATSSSAVGMNDLLIVGPGVLGRIIAKMWQQEFPGSKILGQTMSTDHHSELAELEIVPFLKGSPLSDKVPYVIFCAPPSRTEDYPGDVRIAASNWNGEGSFLFTSSTAPYDKYDNDWCYEDSPVVPLGRSPRTDVLLKAENVVLEAGGCVLRLAEDRGAHTYWLAKGIVDARPDHILNLIHYEDAASLSIAIMKKRLHSRIFVGCDNHPLSRQEVMDCVNRCGKFSKKFEAFIGTDGPLWKKMNNSKTREEIGWEPKYPSFPAFLGLED